MPVYNTAQGRGRAPGKGKAKGGGGKVNTGRGFGPTGSVIRQTPIPAPPGGGGGGAPAPPAAPEPPPAPPLDPQYEQWKVSAGRNLQVGELRSQYETGRIKQDYGFEDFSNPYSRAKLLEESYNRGVRGTTNQYASGGQLHSGAYGRQQNENFRNYDIGRDQLRREYDDLLAGVEFGRLENQANYGIGTSQGDFDTMWNALRNRLGGG